MRLLINVERAKSLYLDERGERKPVTEASPDFFFIGGVEIYNSQKEDVANFVRGFKSRLHPGEDGSTWELKGAKNPPFDNGGLESARNKWSEWSSYQSEISFDYNVYGSFVKLSDFIKNNPEATEKDVIKTAFLEVAKTFVNYGCIESHTHQNGEKELELLPSNFIFDNVDNMQEEAINEAFSEHSSEFKHLSERFAIGKNLKIIKNENYDDNDELIMQFVDMQIYALTKFLYPIKSKKNEQGNMLVNFETYPYLLPKLQAGTVKLEIAELKEISEFFHSITNIFHNIRCRFHRFGWNEEGEQVTSLSIISDKIYVEFGLEAHSLMTNFCNIHKYPDGPLFNRLNN
ncbi:MAG: hypothetical protein ACI88H_001370 [Cocleimonas sp.]